MSGRVDEIDDYLKKLFPINRSLSGEGNRQTLNILRGIIPLDIIEIATGTKVYDWTIPKEWKIREAWIKNSRGEKIIDLSDSNLHVVGYSAPVHKKLLFNELKNKLHYLEKLPGAIPYRTSYYNEDWGFCVSYEQFESLFEENESYEVYIDSELFDGSLSMGELLVRGRREKEYLISTYICHPSMANDNLSGILTAAFLARELLERRESLEYSYRFVFVPETIGAIAYCATHENEMKTIDMGCVVTTCGGPGKFGYKQSWQRESNINYLTEKVLREKEIDFDIYPFEVRGSDERQYSSQAFRIDTVTITKDKYYEYDYYHTSLDNLDFVKAKHIEESLLLYLELLKKLDNRIVYRSTMPYGEVMLSKHDLYPKIGGSFNQLTEKISGKSQLDIILELLFYADGTRDLNDLSRQIEVDKESIVKLANMLVEKSLLEIV